MDLPPVVRCDPSALAAVHAELRLEMARLEVRLTKWTVICAMGVTYLLMLFIILSLTPTPEAGTLAAGSLIAGAAVQLYAVWRM
jgi:hypothetical protein